MVTDEPTGESQPAQDATPPSAGSEPEAQADPSGDKPMFNPPEMDAVITSVKPPSPRGD